MGRPAPITRSGVVARVVFALTVLSTLAYCLFVSDRVRIDTSLQDLNPDTSLAEGPRYATQRLSEDISQRFLMLVKGADQRQVNAAVRELQIDINAINGLSVLTNDSVSSDYLSALSPYRFHLLTGAQRQALRQGAPDALAAKAQRQLYQLGDGIRLIPFEQDPLGWFSDYLLSRLEITGAASLDAESVIVDESGDSHYFTAFSVLIRDYPKDMEAQQHLYQAIEAASRDIRRNYPVELLRSGLFFFAVDSAQSAKGDIQLIAVGSGVGVLVLMLLVFRSLLPLLLSLGSIAIGVGFGIVTSALVFGGIHIFTIVFGASLIGIVVDYSLHYFYHYLSDEKGGDRHKAPGALLRALALSVVTSLVGYGALALSDLVLLKKVALFSCSGLLMAWVSVIVLGPLVTARPIVARQSLLMGVIANLYRAIPRRLPVMAGAGVLLSTLGAAYLILSEIPTNDDPRRFFHVSPALQSQEQQVADLTQVYEPGRYFIVSGTTADELYGRLDAFYAALDGQQEAVMSVRDYLPSPQAQQQNYALQRALYRDNGVLDRFYQRLSVDASQATTMKQAYKEAAGHRIDYAALLNSLPSLPPLWIEHENTIYSFVLIRKNSDLAALESAAQNIAGISYINTLGSAMSALEAQRVTAAQLLLVAYGLIALLLLLHYRSLSAVALLFIPVTASIVTLAILAGIGQAITIFHMMALFLVLGLGMDYIIFAREMRHKPAITQQAILLSAVTSLLSFGLLAFSSMPVVQAFGSTILIGNSINFIAAMSLLALPPSFTSDRKQ
ncbi:MMPL family transporter [Alteromonas halophila]|uniref:MMPL family efflux pump permease component n=1 Tax=Alteromonas halophila TaxID=516698 RepID=A0A918MZF6_9ALTE|nr:MMPL family transporter [Alteromonas halophila]GGW84963.1 MMPL family efflux pump permease component [Alteromonas halophila]